jgi:hypothetical protein
MTLQRRQHGVAALAIDTLDATQVVLEPALVQEAVERRLQQRAGAAVLRPA